MKSADKNGRDQPFPLMVPLELWSGFDHDERRLYQNAQRLLDSLEAQTNSLSDEGEEADFDAVDDMDPAEVVNALSLLQSMDLVTIDSDGDELELTLVALPAEHIKVAGPNGTAQWVFVARPLNPPNLDTKDLN